MLRIWPYFKIETIYSLTRTGNTQKSCTKLEMKIEKMNEHYQFENRFFPHSIPHFRLFFALLRCLFHFKKEILSNSPTRLITNEAFLVYRASPKNVVWERKFFLTPTLARQISNNDA